MNVYWDRRAEKFDNLDWVHDKTYLSNVIGACALKQTDLVLDIGCGTGKLTQALSVESGVVGLDISEEMLWHIPDGVPAILCDVRDMSVLRSEQFDCVTARMVFHHLTDGLSDAIRECHRVLRPGGKLVIAEGIPPHLSLANWYADMMALKEKRLVFLLGDFFHILRMFNCISSMKFVQKDMSLQNWIENGGVPWENWSAMWEMHESLSDEGKQHYNMRDVGDDIIMDWTTAIVVGTK